MREKVVQRFLKYVTFDTTANPNNSNCPSSEGQKVFANYLVEELFEKFDWLFKCTKRLDATNIERNYDLLKAYARKREITARENKDAEYDIIEEEELEL